MQQNAGFHGSFITVRKGSKFDANPTPTPLSEELNVQVKPQVPSYIAGFAAYITLGLMFKHLLSITLFATSVVQAAPCALTERELLGSWEAVGHSGFFEQMAFERDGIQREFNSWRHDRPEISGGQWQLETCKLTIFDSSGPAQIFAVESKFKRLVLTSVNRRSTSTFRKVEEKR